MSRQLLDAEKVIDYLSDYDCVPSDKVVAEIASGRLDHDRPCSVCALVNRFSAETLRKAFDDIGEDDSAGQTDELARPGGSTRA